MTENTKPTIVFVPGAWHLPEGFDAVRALLAERGYPTEAVANPSIDAEPPNKHLNDDIEHLRATLNQLTDEGKETVVITHSYGGLVGAGAVEGLELSKRQQNGQAGGVVMLIYMSAFVVPKGSSLKDMLGGQTLPWMKFDGDYCRSSDPANVFYHDLTPSDQDKWISQLKHTSAAVFSDPATHEPWHTLPCMYLFCEEDRAIPFEAQQGMAKTLGDCTTYRCSTSHSPFLSQPAAVVEAIEIGAKAGIEKSRPVSNGN